MPDSVESAVIDILAKHVKIDRENLTLQTRLEEAGVDSLGLVEIIFQLEEKFDIRIPEAEDVEAQFKDFSTPADVVVLIQQLLKEKDA